MKEIIGKEIEIIEAKNKTHKGKKGKVVDETKHTITLEQDNKKTTILKNAIIKIKTKGNIIHTEKIKKNTYERTKGR